MANIDKPEGMGDPWSIPRDGRIILPFDQDWLWQFETIRHFYFYKKEPTSEQKKRLGRSFKSEMQTIKTFYDISTSHSRFMNFCIMDSNIASSNPGLAIYRPGSKSMNVRNYQINSEDNSMKELKDSETTTEWLDAWGRVIFYQGLSSVDLKELKLDVKTPFSPLPFLIARNTKDPIQNSVELHLDCSRRLGSKLSNPYRDVDNGFHITFYEMVPVESLSGDERWKKGEIYKEAGLEGIEDFRESAFTMFATSEDLKRKPNSSRNVQQQEFKHGWTILLLTPSAFFEDPPTKSDLGWQEVGKHQYKLAAELASILHALRGVTERWEKLYQHIGKLLKRDFMDSEEYVNHLFDDENFSQSRLYFWVIGCLNEFDISIQDNITQWKLFKEARVKSRLEKSQGETSQNEDSSSTPSIAVTEEADPDTLRGLAEKADDLCGTLLDLQSKFKHQRETVLALREGLFNASALMESRASTRLGQNVKLLTYVSIFYLPLAFCAALWAIPNITDNGTMNPFITTTIIVGFGTYMVVFNLGNIADCCWRLYELYRSIVIKPMGEDEQSSRWKTLARRFQLSFSPKNLKGEGEPSEWWILVYTVRVALQWLFLIPIKLFGWILRFLLFPCYSTRREAQEMSDEEAGGSN